MRSIISFCNSVLNLITCRLILLVLMTTAFIINSMLLSTINIAIISIMDDDSVNWNENEKQNVLGIFYIGYALTKFPSGRLSEIVGPRLLIGLSTILAGVLTIVTPFIIKWNYSALLVARIILGFLLGTLFPAQLPLGAKWFSPTSQTSFVTCLQATSLGVAITFFISGFIISAMGWAALFYWIGGFALVWSAIWFACIYDSPGEHPRISTEEKVKIEQEIGISQKKPVRGIFDIPFKQILTSKPVWAIVIAQLAYYFQIIVFQTELPSYMENVLGLKKVDTGIYASLPQVGLYLAALMFSFAGTSLLNMKKISNTSVRKLFESIGLFVPLVFLLLQSFIGKTITLTVVFFSLTLAFGVACTCGHYPNMIEIAPNFAGTIGGFVYTISALSGYGATYLIGFLLKDGKGFEQWRVLFWILAGFDLIGGIVYFMFCSSEVQSWNDEADNEEAKNDLII